MDKSDLSTTFLGRILAKTGGFFLVLAVLFAQLIPDLLVIPVAFFIQANAELTGAQVRQAGLFTAGTLICSNILLLIWVHLFNHQARMMIGERLNGIQTPTSTKDEKLVAWKQITSAPWHYGIAILLVSIFIMILLCSGS